MKQWLIFSVAALLFAAPLAQAGQQDVQISVLREKGDEQKSREAIVTITTKEIIYNVTVQNKRFQPLSNIEVKYMIFYMDPKNGSVEKAIEVSQKGAETIPQIEANRSVTFKTAPLKLVSEQIDAGWSYSSGGAKQSKDRITGVWFRAYIDGQMVGEYTNPSTIPKRQDWKD